MTNIRDIPRVTLPKTDAGNDPGDYKDDPEIAAQLKADVDAATMKAINARTDDPPVVGALMQNPTEDNVALAFGERHKGEFAYLHGTGRWFRWIGTHWEPDVKGQVFHEIRDLARAYNAKGTAYAAKASFVSGVAKLCSFDPAFSRDAAAFDGDNYLLNCPDGTYDLRTSLCRPHNPDDCITHCTPVSPCASGGEVFLKFMGEITDGNKGLEAFLQRALGACLSGAVEEHWIMFWTGSGRNGKNTLGDLVVWLMGDYAGVIPSSTLMTQKNPAHKTEIMSLKGKRLVAAGEIEEGSFWAESKLKEFTGDEYLVGNYMHQDHIQFRRTHKHLIYGNHRPQLRSLDEAMKSRMKIVPFSVSFAGREDMDLPSKLKAEAEFILNWLMDGHRLWMAAGKKIGTCTAIEAEAKDYFESQSTVELWIAECCDIEKNPEDAASSYAKANDAYNNYNEWKKSRGEIPMSATRFGEQITPRFMKKSSNGVRYVGLRLKT